MHAINAAGASARRAARSSAVMASCTLISEFLNQQQHILPTRKIEELIKILEAVDNCEIVEVVICDVGEGHHLKTFPDRTVLWDACVHNDAFKKLV